MRIFLVETAVTWCRAARPRRRQANFVWGGAVSSALRSLRHGECTERRPPAWLQQINSFVDAIGIVYLSTLGAVMLLDHTYTRRLLILLRTDIVLTTIRASRKWQANTDAASTAVEPSVTSVTGPAFGLVATTVAHHGQIRPCCSPDDIAATPLRTCLLWPYTTARLGWRREPISASRCRRCEAFIEASADRTLP